jgi:hypothetical protein
VCAVGACVSATTLRKLMYGSKERTSKLMIWVLGFRNISKLNFHQKMCAAESNSQREALMSFCESDLDIYFDCTSPFSKQTKVMSPTPHESVLFLDKKKTEMQVMGVLLQALERSNRLCHMCELVSAKEPAAEDLSLEPNKMSIKRMMFRWCSEDGHTKDTLHSTLRGMDSSD